MIHSPLEPFPVGIRNRDWLAPRNLARPFIWCNVPRYDKRRCCAFLRSSQTLLCCGIIASTPLSLLFHFLPVRSFVRRRAGCIPGLEWFGFGLRFFASIWVMVVRSSRVVKLQAHSCPAMDYRRHCSRSCFACLTNSPLLHGDCAWRGRGSPEMLTT